MTPVFSSSAPAELTAPVERGEPPQIREDRRALVLLFIFFSFLYGYFYQGGGWNQNTYFDTIRAIVEHGSTEITPYAANTGDIGRFQGRKYSNKPPGIALFGSLPYSLLYRLEKSKGMSPDDPWIATLNAEILTFLVSGVPATLLLLVLYAHFRRRGATTYEGLCLTGAFGAGSLLLPYSGVIMNHAMTAFLLFFAWHLVTSASLTTGIALSAGLLSGLACLTDTLAIPAAGLFVVYLVWKRKPPLPLLLFAAALGICACCNLLFNYLVFGNALTTNQSLQSSFKTAGYLLGVFWWPKLTRALMYTIHPWRGLFFCCPVMLLSLLALRWPIRLRQVSAESVVALSIVAYFFLFILTFNGADGGWAIGPRYVIPCLPFFYVFAQDGFRRFPQISRLLMTLSALSMLSVAAVQALPPWSSRNPVFWCVRQLVSGEVSISTQGILSKFPKSQGDPWASYNLGELCGLHGLWSIAPVAIALVGFVLLVRATKRVGLDG